MKLSASENQPGFVRWIVIFIVALFILSLLGFDLKKSVESEPVQNNFTYVKVVLENFYNRVLRRPAEFIWREFFVEIVWKPFWQAMQDIKNGQPTQLERYAPEVPMPNI